MSITFVEKRKTVYLESKQTSYVFNIDDIGFLQHLYCGKV